MLMVFNYNSSIIKYIKILLGKVASGAPEEVWPGEINVSNEKFNLQIINGEKSNINRWKSNTRNNA